MPSSTASGMSAKLIGVDNGEIYYDYLSPAKQYNGALVTTKDQWVPVTVNFSVTSNSSQDDTYIFLQAYGAGGSIYYVDDWELTPSGLGSLSTTNQMANALQVAKEMLLELLNSTKN